jgi:hypothetical protein
MKCLAVLAIALAFQAPTAVSPSKGQTAPLSTPKKGVTKGNNGQAGEDQTTPQQDRDNPSKAMSAVVQPPTPVTQSSTESEQQENLEIQRKLEMFTGFLVLVGFIQAGTMYWQARLLRGTLKEIQTQAGHMETQSGILGESVAIAKQSADAALKQATIQAAALAQWVDVEFVKTEKVSPRDAYGDLLQSFKLPIFFRAVNNTPYPLTILKAEVNYIRRRGKKGKDTRWEPFTVEETGMLPPHKGQGSETSSFTFYVQPTISGGAVQAYADNSLIALIRGKVFFKPVLVLEDPIREQDFQFVVTCGPDEAEAVGVWHYEAEYDQKREDT